MICDKLKSIRFSGYVLLAALVLIGGFHEYISCGLSAAMLVYLFLKIRRRNAITIPKGLPFLSGVILVAGYALTCLWAVDPGMAFIGFIKFLPLPLFLLCLAQEDNPTQVKDLLPWLAVIMALVSAVGMQFEPVASLFSVAGRLSGLFQYPNTFAIFLLVCELLVLKKEGKKLIDYLLLLLLVVALLYTGSRTVFVIAVLANIAMVLLTVKKKMRILLLAAVALVFAAIMLLSFHEDSILSRYLSISLTESTFVGRILYMADALPLLLKYPFGMGYMGYAYVQTSIQTGVYTVAYIHNDLFQFILDVGIIPGGLFLFFLISRFFSKDIPTCDKVILGAMLLHSLFDFNLQYIGMLMLLMLLCNDQSKTVSCKIKHFGNAAAIALCAVCLYMGCGLALAHWGQRQAADTLYPFNTQNKLQMLSEEQQLDRANKIADEILAYNTQYFAPYSVKAKFAFSLGDFTTMIQNKRTVFTLAPFYHEEYEEYCQMLIHGIRLYGQAGDQNSVDFCIQELLATQKLLRANQSRLSDLGKLIKDQPVTELSDEIRSYIQQLEVNANG